MKIDLSSYDELRCLHLTICEAKFHDAPDRREIQGSPLVAETANKVFDLLISEAPSVEKANGWKAHRVLQSNYIIFPVIKERCHEWFSTGNLTEEQKMRFLEDMAAPYCVPDSIARIILERDYGGGDSAALRASPLT